MRIHFSLLISHVLVSSPGIHSLICSAAHEPRRATSLLCAILQTHFFPLDSIFRYVVISPVYITGFREPICFSHGGGHV